MTNPITRPRRTALPLTGAFAIAALAVLALPAAAQQATPAAAPPPAPAMPSAPTDNAMVNLVRLLVEQGVITRDKGAVLVQQAQTEATQTRAAQQTASGELPPPPAGTIRVPYVPASVRAQIKEELKTEVLAQAKAEGWAAPSQAASDWTRNLKLYGDIRVRSQSTLFAATNSNQIFDFAEINNNGPTDVLNTPTLPYLNTRQDRRNELRLRATLGLDARISDHLSAGLQLATGDDPSPISTNASLGGGFRKRDIWLQKAYFKIAPTDWGSVTFGRFDNPFLSTPLLFDEDLAFDGVYGQVAFHDVLGDGFGLTLRGGAFPLDFGDPDNVSTSPDKQRFPQKYLFSGQVEASADLGGGVDVRVAGAYHYFSNLQGQLSEPCLVFAGQTECSTDGLRPFFLRQGNTLSPLRQIATDPNLPAGQVQPQPQFFGLTFSYHILDLNAVASFPISDKVRATIGGDYAKNLGFKRSDICRYGGFGQPFNNGGTDGDGNICGTTNPTSFVGGNTAYNIYASIGHKQPRKWGEWSASVGYRYIESDAVLDSFADDNFHNGGTNAKGYVIGAQVGLYDGLALGGHWFSANEISGEPYSVDVLQVDLTAAF